MANEVCKKCGRPVSGLPGSLTQWIRGCTCLEEVSSSPAARTNSCRKCGKPIAEQRAGSLTQWIFEESRCSCNQPLPAEDFNPSPKKQPAFEAAEEDEVEIAVDQDGFPTDRFKPLSILGEGVSGIVYVARDRFLHKKVAIKILKQTDPKAVISFQNEGRLSSQLKHANIIQVIDVGISSGSKPFMVMELVKGRNLQQILDNGEVLSIENCVAIFSKILDALSYAHQANILHRDIKPSNIIIDDEDDRCEVKLIDFGIAKLQEFLSETTAVDGTIMVGTPAYMSPDLAQGLNYGVTSDLYSLGCVLFEALTGKQPFIGETPLEVMYMHANSDQPSIKEYFSDSSVTDQLDAVVQKSMDKNPDSRYQSASEFKQALNSILAGSTNETEGDQTSTPTKSRVVSLVVSIILIGVVILFGINSWTSAFQKPAISKKKTVETNEYTNESYQDINEKLSNLTAPNHLARTEIKSMEDRIVQSARFSKAIPEVGDIVEPKKNNRVQRIVESIKNEQCTVRFIANGRVKEVYKRDELMIPPFYEIGLVPPVMAGESVSNGFRVLVNTPRKGVTSFVHVDVSKADIKKYHDSLRLKFGICAFQTGALAEIGTFKKLWGLDLMGCRDLTPEAMRGIGKCTNLDKLRLENQQFNSETWKAVPIKNMRLLSLHNCGSIPSDVIRSLAQAPHLTSLDLTDCDLGGYGSGLTTLLASRKWTDLALSDVENRHILPLQRQPNLWHLKITLSPNLSSEYFKTLARLPKLKIIDVESCPKITERDARAIWESSNGRCQVRLGTRILDYMDKALPSEDVI